MLSEDKNIETYEKYLMNENTYIYIYIYILGRILYLKNMHTKKKKNYTIFFIILI